MGLCEILYQCIQCALGQRFGHLSVPATSRALLALLRSIDIAQRLPVSVLTQNFLQSLARTNTSEKDRNASEQGARNSAGAMRITIDLDIPPSEISAATELLGLLRCGTHNPSFRCNLLAVALQLRMSAVAMHGICVASSADF